MADDIAVALPEGEERTIFKGGEDVLRVEVNRTGRPGQPFGLHLRCKAHPRMEAFMATLGTGETYPLLMLGRHWTIIPKDREVSVYHLTDLAGVQRTTAGLYYRLDRPGQPLMETSPDGSQVVNMSFLRCVGLGEDQGISFLTRGVHEYSTIVRLADNIASIGTSLYQAYLKPVGVSFVVMTQPLT